MRGMILIAHRGNTDGKFESYENEPNYIDKAINEGFDVEVDVWYTKTEQFGWMLFLGHDEPQYGVDFKWFRDRISKLWIHCKNIKSVVYFQECGYEFNYFWHQEDTVTLTSLNHIWAYPGNQPIKNSIAVMPEINNDSVQECKGICSDYIKNYKNKI
jgi:hypothetical protein